MVFSLNIRAFGLVPAVVMSVVVIFLSVESAHAHADASALAQDVTSASTANTAKISADLHCLGGASCYLAAITRTGLTYAPAQSQGSIWIESRERRNTSIALALEPPPPRV